MRRMVFDIETVGVDFDELDQLSKEYMLKFADSPQRIEEARLSTSFYPLTSEIVAVAMLDADTQKGRVYFQNGSSHEERFEKDGVLFEAGREEDILRNFWQQAKICEQFITFNGRLFDGPFLMLRSAMHKIRTTKNLLPYRYSPGIHIDLADQMTFYDAMRRRFPLHMWCRAFGISSPKEQGVNGHMVRQLFRDGKHFDLAKYCFEDVKATYQLFRYWENYLKF